MFHVEPCGGVYPAILMRWPRLLGGGRLLRAIVRELGGIRQQLSRQNDTLERLAAQFAPLDYTGSTPKSTQTEVADTGVTYLDLLEAGVVEDYILKTQHDTGHTPDGDEILTYLADEKTVALQQRLKEREATVLLARADRDRERQEQGR